MKHKAVIFDLDGTLLDTIEDLSDSMNAVLEAERLPTHETEAYKYFVGNGMNKLVELSLPKEYREDTIVRKYTSKMREEYLKRWNNKTRPYAGIPELLTELSERKIAMAVLSNKMDDFTKLIVSELLPHWEFKAVFGERPSVPRKPDPTAAIEISRSLGLWPKNFIFLGDSESDMKTAEASGMYGVGALWGFRKKDELLSSGARAVINEPLELLSFFSEK